MHTKICTKYVNDNKINDIFLFPNQHVQLTLNVTCLFDTQNDSKRLISKIQNLELQQKMTLTTETFIIGIIKTNSFILFNLNNVIRQSV